jgi:hypothetical protein
MFVRNLSFAIALATISYLLPSSQSSTAFAENPDGVVRTFAVYIAPEDLDFESENSVGLVVSPRNHAPISVLEFVDDNPVELSVFDFDSTKWASTNVLHITKGGVQELPVWWLLDEHTPVPPQTGSNTFSGPDSLICYQEVVSVFACSGGDCGYGNDGKFHLSRNSANPKFLVVTAVFSK